MNHKYEQRTICPNGEIRTRTIDANELVDLLLQMHFLKQSGEQLMLESNANDENGETIANILTNHSMTLDEALDLVGAEPLEAENSCDPDYILNGVELWYDDLDLVPDNYGEESEDE